MFPTLKLKRIMTSVIAVTDLRKTATIIYRILTELSV